MDEKKHFITQDGTRIPRPELHHCHCGLMTGPCSCASQPNPKGWEEVDGVKLPPVSPWALLDQDHLDRIHEIWVRSGAKHQQELRDYHTQAIMGIADHG